MPRLLIPSAAKAGIKKIVAPVLRLKWERNAQVKEWIDSGLITEAELHRLCFEWQRFKGPSARPHKVKQRIVSEYQRKHSHRVLVETGSYLGDMIVARMHNFEEIYSIELSRELWERAEGKFKDQPKVRLLHGDSGKVLHELVPRLSRPALFWLDGHYCGGITARGELECPVYGELDAIFRDYPSMAELTDFIDKKGAGYSMTVREDIIVLEK